MTMGPMAMPQGPEAALLDPYQAGPAPVMQNDLDSAWGDATTVGKGGMAMGAMRPRWARA